MHRSKADHRITILQLQNGQLTASETDAPQRRRCRTICTRPFERGGGGGGIEIGMRLLMCRKIKARYMVGKGKERMDNGMKRGEERGGGAVACHTRDRERRAALEICCIEIAAPEPQRVMHKVYCSRSKGGRGQEHGKEKGKTYICLSWVSMGSLWRAAATCT